MTTAEPLHLLAQAATTGATDVLLGYGLPGVVILGLCYAVRVLYREKSDLEKAVAGPGQR